MCAGIFNKIQELLALGGFALVHAIGRMSPTVNYYVCIIIGRPGTGGSASWRGETVALMGGRFARMWEFYLGAVELGFLNGSNMVFQLLVSRDRDDVPVIRDYIVDNERKPRAATVR